MINRKNRRTASKKNKSQKQLKNVLENHGKPIIKNNFKIDGFAVGIIPAGDCGLVSRKGILTSYDPDFQKYMMSIVNLIGGKKPDQLLIRIDKEHTAKIYIDNFPIGMLMTAKRDLKKYSAVSENDIVDIHGISFKDDIVDCSPQDGEKVIWLFRCFYSFVLFFDLTGELFAEKAKEEMANAYKRLVYHDFFQSIKSVKYDKLLELGWFPFIRLVGKRYEELFSYITYDKEKYIEEWVKKYFTKEYVEEFVKGWYKKTAFEKQSKHTESGLRCFYEGNYISCIDTLTPTVERIINEAFLGSTGKPLDYKSHKIIKFIHLKGSQKFTSVSSLALPDDFKMYLEKYFFKSGMSKKDLGKANRNPVSHGRADSDSYNIERALQLILTLDQIAYYIGSIRKSV